MLYYLQNAIKKYPCSPAVLPVYSDHIITMWGCICVAFNRMSLHTNPSVSFMLSNMDNINQYITFTSCCKQQRVVLIAKGQSHFTCQELYKISRDNWKKLLVYKKNSAVNNLHADPAYWTDHQTWQSFHLNSSKPQNHKHYCKNLRNVSDPK